MTDVEYKEGIKISLIFTIKDDDSVQLTDTGGSGPVESPYINFTDTKIYELLSASEDFTPTQSCDVKITADDLEECLAPFLTGKPLLFNLDMEYPDGYVTNKFLDYCVQTPSGYNDYWYLQIPQDHIITPIRTGWVGIIITDHETGGHIMIEYIADFTP